MSIFVEPKVLEQRSRLVNVGANAKKKENRGNDKLMEINKVSDISTEVQSSVEAARKVVEKQAKQQLDPLADLKLNIEYNEAQVQEIKNIVTEMNSILKPEIQQQQEQQNQKIVKPKFLNFMRRKEYSSENPFQSAQTRLDKEVEELGQMLDVVMQIRAQNNRLGTVKRKVFISKYKAAKEEHLKIMDGTHEDVMEYIIKKTDKEKQKGSSPLKESRLPPLKLSSNPTRSSSSSPTTIPHHGGSPVGMIPYYSPNATDGRIIPLSVISRIKNQDHFNRVSQVHDKYYFIYII
jgi:hypothetical protein